MHAIWLLLAGGLAAATETAGATAVTITVDTGAMFQTIDGFGFSEAFQRAEGIVALAAPQRAALVDLLFNATTGAGFTILRTGIGSSPNRTHDWMNTIEPVAPVDGPGGRPTYAWDYNDTGQLWVAQQAVRYGVRTFYADAWSAPGFMKTNSDDANGGMLCGNPGAPACAMTATGADWRMAYAAYLRQYVRFYAASGVRITHLGFLNEPDISTPYASMRMDGQQAADFIRVLYQTLHGNDPANVMATTVTEANAPNTTYTSNTTNATNTTGTVPVIACCDATGWDVQRNMTAALVAAGVEPLLGVVTSHLYTSGFDGALATTQRVWMSEYADLGNPWSTAWFSEHAAVAGDTRATAGDGLTWARTLHTGLTTGNLSAFLWWVATQDAATNGNNNEKLVLIDNAHNTFTVARRLWAFAHFSRAARPGAVRVGTTLRQVGGGSSTNGTTDSTASAPALLTTAYRNTDGAVAVVAINSGDADVAVAVAGMLNNRGCRNGEVQAWVTDNDRDMAAVAGIALAADGTTGRLTVPAHGMMSMIVRPK